MNIYMNILFIITIVAVRLVWLLSVVPPPGPVTAKTER